MSRKVFIPGCALPSYNPELVEKMVIHLKNVYPNISVVQKCCGKPTKAVGQYELFKKRFGGLLEDIKDCEGDEVVLACQSCMKTLGEAPDLKVTSLWELLPQIGLPKELVGKAKNSDVVFSIHDSCSVRNETGIHDGIRWIMNELGYKTAEPERTRDMTRCCGFGGMIVPAVPDTAMRVMKRRKDDFPTDHIVAYCAACRQSMSKVGGSAWHILDLVFGPVVMKGDEQPFDSGSNPRISWTNRYKSKKKINRIMK